MGCYRHLHCETRQPSRKEKATSKALHAALEEAQQALAAHYEAEASTDDEAEGDDPEEVALQQAVEQAQRAVNEFDASLEVWTDEQKAQGGAFVILSNSGVPVIERGLIRPQERTPTTDANGQVVDVPAKVKPLHGEALCNRLTAHRTAVAQAELLREPTVALALLMHSMIPKVFAECYAPWLRVSTLEISATTTADKLRRVADDLEGSAAWQYIEEQRQKWATMLPTHYRDLLPWLLAQSDDVMANLFAFCVAATVDGVSATDSPHAINAVLEVLSIDMTQYWEATRASYLDHVPKQRLVDVVAQAESPDAGKPLLAMKKGDAAEAAQLRLVGTGWLPEVLRNRDVPSMGNDSEE